MLRTLFISLAVLSLFSAAAFAGDDAVIKTQLDQFQAAWNKDDTAAMAALWAENGSLINPMGRVANNRAEVEKIFADEHSSMFKNTKYEMSEVKVQWVTAHVAMADVTGNISGIHGSDGGRSRIIRIMWSGCSCRKAISGWRRRAALSVFGEGWRD